MTDNEYSDLNDLVNMLHPITFVGILTSKENLPINGNKAGEFYYINDGSNVMCIFNGETFDEVLMSLNMIEVMLHTGEYVEVPYRDNSITRIQLFNDFCCTNCSETFGAEQANDSIRWLTIDKIPLLVCNNCHEQEIKERGDNVWQ